MATGIDPSRAPAISGPQKNTSPRISSDVTPTGTVFCPMDDGAALVARFAYPGGHSVTVLLHQSGCLNALNGDVDRAATAVR